MLHIVRRHMPSFLVFIAFLLFGFSSFAQAKIILQGKDKDSATIQVSTGDKYYDSGGQGGSRIPRSARQL
ncbi:MAG: hypothetical protein IPF93_21020 [Saprospiraceae bacterium]|nr:hypothetical protein [Saprospiraceae bacterium]